MSTPTLSPTTHAKQTIEFVRKRTDSVVLFYSGGGKDSLALLEMLCKEFKTVHCVFMYFVKDLDHQKPFLTLLKRYPNAVLHQYPHWNLAEYFANGEGIEGQYEVPKISMADIETNIRLKTGCEWICYGWKQADSMYRRVILRTYLFDAISYQSKKFYPLSLWKKADVLRYVTLNRLPMPLQYNKKGASQGLDLLPEPLMWLRDNWPGDYAKVCRQFPRAAAIVRLYEVNGVPDKKSNDHYQKRFAEENKLALAIQKEQKKVERQLKKQHGKESNQSTQS